MTPGAGLKQLDPITDDTDFIFDSIFSVRHESHDIQYISSDQISESPEPEVTPIVRVYLDDNDMYDILTSLALLLSPPMNSVPPGKHSWV